MGNDPTGWAGGGVSVTRNAAFSILSFFLAAVTAFIVSPLIIQALGGASYGLLSMAGELTRQFGLFDLGIRAALMYFVAQGLARGDRVQVEETWRTALLILSGLGTLAAAAAVPLVIWLPHWFTLDGVPVDEARASVGLLLLVFAAGLPMSLLSATLAGLRRFDLDNTISIVCSLVTTVMVVIGLRVWGSLLAVAIPQAAGVVLRWVLQMLLLKRMHLGLRLRPVRLFRSRVRALFTYGGANLIVGAASVVTLQADLIIIGRILGASAAGSFQISRYLAFHLLSLIGAITMTLPSSFTHYHAHDDTEGERNLYLSASRYVSALACLLAAIILVYGASFVSLWVGPQFLDGDRWNRADTILWLMTLAMLARSMGGVSNQYLLGVRRLRFFTAVRVAEAIASLSASIVLVQWIGLAGVAFSKLGVSVVSHVVFNIPYSCRTLEIGFARYARTAVVPPILLFATVGGVALLMRMLIPPVHWVAFFSGCTITGLVGLCVGWLLIFQPEERRHLLERARLALHAFQR